MPYTYQYPRPALTADSVVFGWDAHHLQVLLIQRNHPPFEGMWALPGGFVEIDEELPDAARRELREETGLDVARLDQLHTFGQIDRDPRDRVVSIVYYGLIRIRPGQLKAASDARNVRWLRARRPGRLAFDHRKIVRMAVDRIKQRMFCEPIVFRLLPRTFALDELFGVYEDLFGRAFDRQAFLQQMKRMHWLVPSRSTGTAVHSTTKYRFDKRSYQQWQKQRFT